MGSLLLLLCGDGAKAATRPCDQLSAAALAPALAIATARTGLPASWIGAVMDRESARYPCAVSPKGAMGLMQLMPATWSALQARLSLGPSPFEPGDNVLAGAAYLRDLYDRFGAAGMLAAYNAGPERYLAAIAEGRRLPAETLAYVAALAPRLQTAAPKMTPVAPPPDTLFAGLRPLERAKEGPRFAPSAPTNSELFVSLAPQGGAP